MSEIEEIEAAIDRLADQRDASTQGLPCWEVAHDEQVPVIHPSDSDSGLAFVSAKEDADLIVTLHRTIDAQLAILHIGLNTYRVHISAIRRALGYDKAALALARAINGANS